MEGTGPDGRWTSTGLSAGSYTVNAKVDDGQGRNGHLLRGYSRGTEAQPATDDFVLHRSQPDSTGRTHRHHFHCQRSRQRSVDLQLQRYGRTVTGTGPKAEFDSTGLQAGSYTVKCSVSDGKGGTADASTNVDVQQPPPPPQATKVGDCSYGKPGSSRVDNVCKRVLDDVALRLKNDPNAKLVITGYADSHEPRAAKVG